MNERATADRENTKENDGQNQRENDGNQSIIILILGLAQGLVVIALVVSILIKIIKDKIIEANTEIEEVNEIYGNLEPEQYYEEDKKSEVVHPNTTIRTNYTYTGKKSVF